VQIENERFPAMTATSASRTNEPRKNRGRVMATAAALMLSAAVIAPLATPAFTTEARAAVPGVDFSELAERVLPAVVNVSTTQKVAQASFGDDFPRGTPFDEFFRQFRDQRRFGGNDGGGREVERTALGSGFIIDKSGYVVTNNHVAGDATDIKVTLQDGTTLPATLVGRDEKTDLALLKVESDKDLPFVNFAGGDEIKVGRAVMAVGNPFGLGGTVTAGIVSARGRDIHSGPFDDYIQTDAAINRGNSGGPLFDMEGNVIGINTAIFSPSGGSVGIGFAIPATLAQPILEQIRDHGQVSRGWLGVAIQPVTDEIAEGLGLSGTKGALVSSVTEGSPAEKGGLEAGDVITSVGGKSVEQFRDVARLVAGVDPGTSTDVGIVRGGETKTLSVAVGSSPDTQAVAATDDGESATPSLGLALGPITPDVAEDLDLAPTTRGAVVMQVEPGSPADEQGLRPGDVILKVGKAAVSGPGEAVKLLDAAKKDKKPVLVQIQREGSQRFVALSVKAA